MEQPLVSVVCESYNHEPFIRRCLEGFLIQQTDFPFEVLVHDDASTDGSQAIIREFEARCPNIVKPIYQVENQYSKGVSIWANIQFPRAKGKYIALCEGDDYWTDPLKLQKQVAFMEAHPECSMCFHNAITHWEDGREPDKPFAKIEDRYYSGRELVSSWLSPTASFLIRSDLCCNYADYILNLPQLGVGDMPLLVFFAKYGEIYGSSEIMCVYRKHPGGYTQFTDCTRTYNVARSWEARRDAFGAEYYDICTKKMTGLFMNAMIRSIREINVTVFLKSFYRGILKQPTVGIKALIAIPKERRERLSKADE